MRSRNPTSVLRLAAAITEESAVDWQKERTESPELEPTLDALRVVETILRGYRTLGESRRLGARAPAIASTRPARAPAPQRPALFAWGPLLVLERIGEGTFGEVFRAHDPALERDVALKLWRLPATERAAERFVLEARRLARVRHPGVLVVHGADRHGGRAGMWTDLIEGRSLEQVLAQQGPFGGREAALVGIELCRALAAVHAAGLVHRDVKTTNVMREHGGRIVLMDFGAVGEMTALGSVRPEDGSIGTPLTLAPEILEGHAATPASDLYALGVLLYRLASAEFPVAAESLDELRERHRRGARVALRERRPDLASELVTAIEHALEPDPARRPPGLGAFERELALTIGGPGAAAGRARAKRARREAPAAAPADTIPHNLPETVTRPADRETERAACSRLLAEARWLTLTGPAGCGKTRLALAVAEGAMSAFADGVWLADLESVTDPERVPHAVAVAIGAPERAGEPSLAALSARLREAQALILLDHAGGLGSAVAALGHALLAACPRLSVIATAHEAVGLAEERVFEVPAVAGALPAPAAAARPAPEAPPYETGREAAFVGRDEELAAFDQALERTRARAGRTLLLSGEAGLGKSRLMREFRARAEARGALCLEGGCVFHGGRNFEPFLAALEEFNRRFGPAPAGDAARSPLASASLFSTLETMLDPGHRAGREPRSREQIWLLLDAALKRIAKYETLVLFLDDLQWGDEGTFSLLNHVTRHLEGARLLIVGAYRPEDLHETPAPRGPRSLEEVLRMLAPLPAFVPVRLTPLDPGDTRSLVASLLAPGMTVEECAPALWDRAQGNPFFTIEVIRWMAGAQGAPGALPRTVTDVVMRRLARLTSEERDLLDLAAAEGEVFHSDTLEAALGVSRVALLKRLRGLEQIHQLVVSTDEGHRFSHGLIREVLLNAMPAELRREYHGAVATHLASRYGERPVYAGIIGFQLWDAHRFGEAAPHFVRASREARRLFLNERALHFLERALEGHRRAPAEGTSAAEILRAQCEVLLQLGRPHLARSVAEEALDEERRRGDERGAAAALAALADAALAQGDLAAAESFFTSARQGHAALGDDRQVARCDHQLGAVATRRGDFEQALLRLEAALDRPAGAGGELEVARIRLDVADVLYRRGEYDRAIETFEAVVAGLRRLDERYDLSRGLNRLGNALFQRGRTALALERYEEALDLAASLGDLHGMARLRANLGNVHLVGGDSDRALRSYRESLAIFEEIGDRTGAGQIHVALGNVCFMRGELEDAAKHYRGSIGPRADAGDRPGLANSLDNLGVVEYHLGRWGAALENLGTALRHRIEIGDRPGSIESALNLGALLAVLGDTEAAALQIADAERDARALGDVRKRARALLSRATLELWKERVAPAATLLAEARALAIEEPSIAGRVALLEGLATGEARIAEERLREALEIAERSGSVAEQATARLALGRLHARSGRAEEARAEIDRAREQARARHLALLEIHAVQALRELGPGAIEPLGTDARLAELVAGLERDLPARARRGSTLAAPRFPPP